MVKRQISVQRYVFAGIISLLLFLLGVLLGLVLDYERLEYLNERSALQELSYKGLQLQYLYLSDLGDYRSSCDILRAAIEDSIHELDYSLEIYEKYEQKTNVNKKDYELISRKYLQDNLRYWMLSKKTRDLCNEDIINVLYFYSQEKCDICPNQGVILTYFKVKLEDNILIFPINIDLEDKEGFIKLLRLQYNVTELPTIIVNDVKFQGIISKERLAEILCQQYQNKELCLV